MQVKSSINTPVMQGAKQMHIERRCDCELPRQSFRLGRSFGDFFLTQVLLWFCLELPRKGIAKGGGICDARVEVHPVNWLTPEVRNPEIQPHFVHSGGRDSYTAFHWESPTKENFYARHLVNNCCAGALFSPIVVASNVDASRFSKLTHPRSKRRNKIFFFKEEIKELRGAVEKLAPFVARCTRHI